MDCSVSAAWQMLRTRVAFGGTEVFQATSSA